MSAKVDAQFSIPSNCFIPPFCRRVILSKPIYEKRDRNEKEYFKSVKSPILTAVLSSHFRKKSATHIVCMAAYFAFVRKTKAHRKSFWIRINSVQECMYSSLLSICFSLLLLFASHSIEEEANHFEWFVMPLSLLFQEARVEGQVFGFAFSM